MAKVIRSAEIENSNIGPTMNLGGAHARNLGLHGSSLSLLSFMSMTHGENIHDSKMNEERPMINKSLGKHQINNTL